MERRDLGGVPRSVAVFESLAKSLAIIAVPIIVAVAGSAANRHFEEQRILLERQRVDQDVLKQAMEVIFLGGEKLGADASLEVRRLYRAHWIKTYNQYAETYAKVGISDDLVAAIMDRDLPAPTDSKSKTAGGWVAVGLFSTGRQQDLNFDVLEPKGYEWLKKDMIIRARWSVPIRLNTDHPDAPSESFLNPEIGRMPGGSCAKVVEYNSFVRGQAWAKINQLECPSEQEPDHVAQLR